MSEYSHNPGACREYAKEKDTDEDINVGSYDEAFSTAVRLHVDSNNVSSLS